MKGLAIIVGPKKAAADEEDEDAPESKDAASESKLEYAKLVREAFEDKDDESLAQALEGFVRCCNHNDEE